ncbi:MAG: hypothetical protein AAF420_15000 [Pseudomonadota bacterium]
MFQMLSCFNLPSEEDLDLFRENYAHFVEEMRSAGLVEGSGPIGRRQSDTPMDTDEERHHEYFSVMTFRDREQVDAAYAHIMEHQGPTDEAHNNIYTKVTDPIFICWEDL